jgi:peptidyl-prolyl cis-trans isomerase D
MMNWLRGQVSRVILGVLLVAFVGWIVIELGMQGRIHEGTGGAAAVVNGDRVSLQELWLLFNQEMDGTWGPMRGSLTEQDERELRGEVLERLVNQTLAWQEAKRLKLAVSADEAREFIRSQPAFLNPETRQFDPARYQQILSRMGVPPPLYEMEQERTLSAGRIESLVREAVRVTDLELWLEYLRWRRRMRAALLEFPLAPVKASLKVTDDEIRNFWERNRGEYEKPERVRLRHLVIAVNPQAGPEASAQAKARMEAVLEELKAGKDFALVAREKSDDSGTSARGGDLGWRRRGELIPEYDRVAFSLRSGQVSEVFETKFGLHLIKVEKHEREEKPSFAELKNRIRDRIQTARARAELGAAATRAHWIARREKDLAKAGARVDRKPRETGWFEWDKVRPAGLSATQFLELVKALSDVEVGDVTGVVATPEGFLIAQLLEERHQRAPEAGFLKDRDRIEPVLLERKRRAAYEAWIAALREKAKIRILLEGGA